MNPIVSHAEIVEGAERLKRSLGKLPSKPPFRSPCNHCGICCALTLCPVGALAFPEAQAPCPALFYENEQARCGLVAMEVAAGAEPLIQQGLGIGCGCSLPDPDTTEAEVAAFDADSRKKVFGS